MEVPMSAKNSKTMTPEERARYYRELIREAQRTGQPLSVVEAAHGLTPGRISRWRYEQKGRKLKTPKPRAKTSSKQVTAQASQTPRLVPVRVVEEQVKPASHEARGSYEVLLCGGRTLRLPADFDRARVVALVAALESAC